MTYVGRHKQNGRSSVFNPIFLTSTGFRIHVSVASHINTGHSFSLGWRHAIRKMVILRKRRDSEREREGERRKRLGDERERR